MTRNVAKGPRAAVMLEVLVEEESATEALKPILRKITEGRRVRLGVRQFRGKPDLVKRLPERLRGYAQARRAGHDVRVVVLLDRDNDDCSTLKKKLDSLACQAGLIPKSRSGSGTSFNVLTRIAVRELESWYFGDWKAVRSGFPKVTNDVPRAYRGDTDAVPGKCSDAFEKALRANGVRLASKPEWARRIGPHLSLNANRSASFRKFVSGVREILDQ